MTCELQHQWDFTIFACSLCGVEYPFSPSERYRFEKMKRKLPLQRYRRDGKPYQRLGAVTHLACPSCGSEVVVLGKPTKWRRPARLATCADCMYVWRTCSREAFDGTYQIEVRG